MAFRSTYRMRGGNSGDFPQQAVDVVDEHVGVVDPHVKAWLAKQAEREAEEEGDRKEREFATALHESGHCVATVALCQPFHSLIIRSETSGGFLQYPPRKRHQEHRCAALLLPPTPGFSTA